MKNKTQILWSKQKCGNVAYVGEFITDIDFKTTWGNVYRLGDISAISDKCWMDDVDYAGTLPRRRKGYSTPVRSLPCQYFPNIQSNSVVKHIDVSTVTSEWGIQSYYMRMGVPINLQSAVYFRQKYRINTVELIHPDEPVMYIDVCDKFCEMLKQRKEYGTVVQMEQGIGLMTNDETVYAINTILVLFISDEQRQIFERLIKDKLGIYLPKLKEVMSV